MGFAGLATETATDLLKNENVQNKAADLLGMLFPYAGIEKRALEMYIADVEKSNMSSESKVIAVLSAKDTIKKLKNKKAVADIAVAEAKEGTAFDKHSGVDQEWLERFMDSAGFVSSEKVQMMWGKVLAGEFEQPGSTPLNMIRILSEITPLYAHAFQLICSMRRLLIIVDDCDQLISVRDDIVVPYQNNSDELRELGLSFNTLNELETLGLIKFDPNGGYVALKLPDNIMLTYCDGMLKEIKEHKQGELPIGSVILTEAGECLRKITNDVNIKGFSAMEATYMNEKGVKYKDKTCFYIDNSNGCIKVKKIAEDGEQPERNMILEL